MRPNPIIWRASRSLGTGKLRSAAAACTDSAICEAESTTVPSQSNTNRSKRLGMRRAHRRRRRCGGDQELFQVLGERRFDGDRLTAERMDEAHALSVQEHALQPLLCEGLVQREVSIFIVAYDWKSQVGEVHSNLMSAAGHELG